MKTLLGIIGSPRKLGNSEIFVKELYSHLPDLWRLKLIRLPDFDIQPCRACYQCVSKGIKCPQKDDFNLIMESLMECDAYVVAAPTYLLGANASLKRFLDRGLSLYTYLDKLWKKPAVGVAIAGTNGMEGYTKLVVESFVKLVMGDLRGSAVIYGAFPGEIFIGDEGSKTAKRLAEALIDGNKKNSNVPVCPLCGGDTFRFLPNCQIRCMLCSNTGYYEWKECQMQIHLNLPEHHLFLSHKAVERHIDLIRSMKKDFLARRKDLKAITESFNQEVTWISPPKKEN